MTPLFPEVSVDGETIPAAQIAAEAQNHPADPGKPGLAWQAAARALVVRALLLQSAARAGLDAVPEARGPGREETNSEALIRAYLDKELSPAPITEADCRAVYEARPPEAAALGYDDVVRDIHEGLERAAWTNAARTLIARLVEQAEIEGVDMAPRAAQPG